MAVFTPVSTDECALFLRRYHLGELQSFRGIAEGIENTNYYLRTSHGRFILTLFERRTPEADLPFFVALMQHLSSRGFPCPRPIVDNQGQALQRLNGRPALLVSFLEGAQAERISPAHCASLGAAMAEFHQAMRDFPERRANSMGLEGQQELLSRIKGKGDTIAPGFDALLQEEFAYVQEHWPKDSPTGIIHADLFPDNVFFNDRHDSTFAGMIDFYFACNSLLLYELAICVNAWCFRKDPVSGAWEYDPQLAQALCSHYQQGMQFSDAQMAALPVLCRAGALRFLLTRAHDFLFPATDAMVAVKDPGEYVQKLQYFRQAEGG